MKTCSTCGSQQDDNAVFCSNCGSTFPIIRQTQQTQQPQYGQQYQQPQAYAQPQYAQTAEPFTIPNKKAKSKTPIIIICAAVAVIAITLIILFVFVFKSNKDKIIGTWQEVNANGKGSCTRFNKDGTAEVIGKGSRAKYEVDGDTVTFTYDGHTSVFTIVELTSTDMTLRGTTDSGRTMVTTFKKISNSDAANSAASDASLKTANTNAKLIFTSANNKAADLMADGNKVEKLVYSGPVSGLSGTVGSAIKKSLKNNNADGGYVYIYFDPDDTSGSNFAQWSDSANGPIIGQYPSPIKSEDECPQFGHFKES